MSESTQYPDDYAEKSEEKFFFSKTMYTSNPYLPSLPKIKAKEHFVFLVLCAFFTTLLLSGCGGSATLSSAKATSTVAPVATSPNSSDKSGQLYVDPAGNGATFLQFTEQQGTITGTGTQTYITATQGVESVTPQTFTFSGTHVGDTVTLTFYFSYGSKTDTGTLKDGALTLAVTQQDGSIKNFSYHAASIDEYNQALATMKQKVQNQNQTYFNTQNAMATAQAQATAQASQQSAVQNDNDGLTNALNALKSDSATLSQISYTGTLDGYARDWAQMQKDYAKEQTDAAKGCGDGGTNLGTVQADDGTVQADDGSIQADDGSLQADDGTYDSNFNPVENDIKNVKGWWSQLQADAAKNTTHTPAPAYTDGQVTQALSDAQAAETTALKTKNAAHTSAQGYDTNAVGLLKQADAIPNGMHC